MKSEMDKVVRGGHITVLLHESIDGLALAPGDIFVDGTLGGGGHSLEACSRMGDAITIVGIDADEDAIARSETRLRDAGCRIKTAHGNYADIGAIAEKLGLARIDKVLLDLGLSSFQIDESGRGFTFQKDEPLLMTMKKEIDSGTLTAADIVNSWDEENLEAIIRGYGEERFARRIARAIAEARDEAPIETTFRLASIIEAAVPKPRGPRKINPATKTFQALRIAVNDELQGLGRALDAFFERLSPGGRMAVISFHSLEDRIVKHFYKKKADEGAGRLVNKKPIVPSDEEVASNKRSRSAKLRIIEKA